VRLQREAVVGRDRDRELAQSRTRMMRASREI
jgi:hypothetical protein